MATISLWRARSLLALPLLHAALLGGEASAMRVPRSDTRISASDTTAETVAAPHVVFLLADVRKSLSHWSTAVVRRASLSLTAAGQDFGFADIGYRNSTDARTPHLDALAGAGVKLDHMYTQLVCSPSRGAIMTGKFPYRLGLSHGFIAAGAPYGLPLTETTIAQEMTTHGWSCHMVGKCTCPLFSILRMCALLLHH
jgi:hypothetical protein